MENDFAHAIFWSYHLTIFETGQITISNIIHLYHVCPVDNIIPANCRLVVTKKPVSAMREPKNINKVLIKETVPAGFST